MYRSALVFAGFQHENNTTVNADRIDHPASRGGKVTTAKEPFSAFTDGLMDGCDQIPQSQHATQRSGLRCRDAPLLRLSVLEPSTKLCPEPFRTECPRGRAVRTRYVDLMKPQIGGFPLTILWR
jgi:hypothetical protein